MFEFRISAFFRVSDFGPSELYMTPFPNSLSVFNQCFIRGYLFPQVCKKGPFHSVQVQDSV